MNPEKSTELDSSTKKPITMTMSEFVAISFEDKHFIKHFQKTFKDQIDANGNIRIRILKKDGTTKLVEMDTSDEDFGTLTKKE